MPFFAILFATIRLDCALVMRGDKLSRYDESLFLYFVCTDFMDYLDEGHAKQAQDQRQQQSIPGKSDKRMS